ncbi:glycosyltransferase [Methylacidimicrobium cyclopophantes]|uniref:glycosyltransferase n=1 Tax=Methylacidimicrobium cyclopophantes TaxID=1041766 RepID=UPI0015B481CD|nr:glycosyltransferase [Methylacidimicrobium cyclopophantes]
MKLAVVYCNFGPYHVARAKALAAIRSITPVCIEVADHQGTHPWTKDSRREIPIRTLFRGASWEQLPSRRIGDHLVAALEEEEPDVVATIGYGWGFMRRAALWAMRTRRGSVLMHETARQDKRRLPWKEAIKGWIIARHYHAALVGGKSHGDYLAELGFPRERMWAPHSVVDNGWFAQEVQRVRQAERAWRERLGVPPRYFVFVGRLASEKNVERLLEAYRRYRSSSSSDWGFVILGDGPLREKLERQARANRLPKILFRGFVPNEDLPPYYALAGCFVLPSLVEPWGLVVNEAMASSLPVLISDRCGCVPDLVSERNGFLVEPTDVAGLTRLLERVASMSSSDLEAMGRASREIVERFSPEAWARGLHAAARCAWEAAYGTEACEPQVSRVERGA